MSKDPPSRKYKARCEDLASAVPSVGRTFIGVRTHTSGPTVYLYDPLNGKRFGWIPEVDAPVPHIGQKTYAMTVVHSTPSGYIWYVEFAEELPVNASQLRTGTKGLQEINLQALLKHELCLSRTGRASPYEGPAFQRMRPAYSTGTDNPRKKLLEVDFSGLEIRAIPGYPNLQQRTKENIMNDNNARISKTLNINKNAISTAAFMEAGRVANNVLVKQLVKALPAEVSPFVSTPVGKLVIANLAYLVLSEFRPGDPKLNRLSHAMLTSAYGEAVKQLNIDGVINKLLNSPELKKVLSSLGSEEVTE